MVPEALFSTSLRLVNQTLLNLHPATITTLPEPIPGRKYMLYAHIPFCEVLCPYCSFNRYAFDEATATTYFASLREEMHMISRKGYDFTSMYIGGGTPTILLNELAKVIDLARCLFDIQEVSCETNPNHLTPELVEVLGKRVQRMSVGVQSFDNDLLRKINRLDRFGTGEQILERIRNVKDGFESLNVDMIFNFPGQNEDILRKDIEMVVASGANQTTFYPLMTSPSVDRAMRLTVGEVTHSKEAEYYHLIVDELSHTHELSTAWTFSRKGGGLIDEYIVDYDDYVGVGSGAFSFLDGTLLVNAFSLRNYRQLVSSRKAPLSGMRTFGEHDTMWYRFMMDLFGLKLDKHQFKERFGRSIEKAMPLEMAFFKANGAFAENNKDYITLTPAGRYMMVVMMREFFTGINRLRDQARQVPDAPEVNVNGLLPVSRPIS
ncbi:MAG: coproporphyrinogen III oxidase family protein [Anaerolineaceae bacterium]|nr:coproporphyrinogen III oxidase family protein [Anaerolineaceae bacterium]